MCQTMVSQWCHTNHHPHQSRSHDHLMMQRPSNQSRTGHAHPMMGAHEKQEREEMGSKREEEENKGKTKEEAEVINEK